MSRKDRIGMITLLLTATLVMVSCGLKLHDNRQSNTYQVPYPEQECSCDNADAS